LANLVPSQEFPGPSGVFSETYVIELAQTSMPRPVLQDIELLSSPDILQITLAAA